MYDPKIELSAFSETIPLTAIPMRYRKSLCEWLGETSIFSSNQFVPGEIYEFWLDNYSTSPSNKSLLDI